MIIIEHKLGNIANERPEQYAIDFVQLEWFECTKRILHKTSVNGREVTLKFLDASPAFIDGDIIYRDHAGLIAIEILECESICIYPSGMTELAEICYEIGNRHLPLFFSGEELLVAFEGPLFRWLENSGFKAESCRRKLMRPLKSTVVAEPHISAQVQIIKTNS